MQHDGRSARIGWKEFNYFCQCDGRAKGFAREHQNGFLWDLDWTTLNDALSGDFHREYLSIWLDSDVLVCPIPSTYVETHSLALRPAVLWCGNDVASRHIRICRGLTQ
jgi:hypothetical protein